VDEVTWRVFVAALVTVAGLGVFLMNGGDFENNESLSIIGAALVGIAGAIAILGGLVALWRWAV
jgi:hypothetical protein